MPDRIEILVRKKKELESKIQSLSEELRAVESQIVQAKFDEYFVDVNIPTNKKSRKKQHILYLVRHYLRDFQRKYQGGGLTTKQLFELIEPAEPDLKYATFRSYLHRFEQEDLVVRLGHGAPWRLPEFLKPGSYQP